MGALRFLPSFLCFEKIISDLPELRDRWWGLQRALTSTSEDVRSRSLKQWEPSLHSCRASKLHLSGGKFLKPKRRWMGGNATVPQPAHFSFSTGWGPATIRSKDNDRVQQVLPFAVHVPPVIAHLKFRRRASQAGGLG